MTKNFNSLHEVPNRSRSCARLTRSAEGAEQLSAAGAEAQRGDLTDLDSLCREATGMDAVVNLAFNHDLSQ